MALTIPSQKTIHETHRVAEDGAVDADGHILEPPTLWEEYIDPKFRDRALMFKLDEKGLEELWYDGKVSELSRRGFPATLGAMGAPDLVDMAKNPDRTYLGEAPYGSMDPQERIDVLDAEHIDTAILYTTVGLLWEAEIKDPELSQAYSTAYNRWICEFCADEPRLIPTAHLSLTDVDAAAKEFERAVGEGARGGYVAPFSHDRPAVRPSRQRRRSSPPPRTSTSRWRSTRRSSRPPTKGDRMGADNFRNLRLLSSVAGSDGVRHQFTTLFDYGVFDKFPRLKILVLECGAGWVGYWLDRIDAVFSHTVIGERVPLTQKPSDYFRERVWISADPDERMIPALAQRYGVERFLWASDFPHADHTPEYIHDLNELVAAFPEDQRAAFIGGNARRCSSSTARSRRPRARQDRVKIRRTTSTTPLAGSVRCAGPASRDLAVLEARATTAPRSPGPRLSEHGPLAVRDTVVRRHGDRIALFLDDDSVLRLKLFWPRRQIVAALTSIRWSRASAGSSACARPPATRSSSTPGSPRSSRSSDVLTSRSGSWSHGRPRSGPKRRSGRGQLHPGQVALRPPVGDDVEERHRPGAVEAVADATFARACPRCCSSRACTTRGSRG